MTMSKPVDPTVISRLDLSSLTGYPFALLKWRFVAKQSHSSRMRAHRVALPSLAPPLLYYKNRREDTCLRRTF
jgi:hypothetical protein